MVQIAGSVQQIEASPEDVGLSSAGMARLQRHIQAYVDAGKFPGAISMVQRRGKVVHFQTYGLRAVEAGTPVAYLRAADNVSGPLPIPLRGAISRSSARATGFQDLVPPCCPAWAHKSGVELDEHQPTPLFILSVAGATAAPERVTRRAATTHGRLIPLPSPVYTAATPWPSPSHG
jgi:hypothetical protein